MPGLSPSAVKSANEALWNAHPELRGRQLKSGQADAYLRKEWMGFYEAANSPAIDKRVASPCATCATVTNVEQSEILAEAAELKRRFIALGGANQVEAGRILLYELFMFDSKWWVGTNNQSSFSFRRKTLTGSDLNYYFQGVLGSWLGYSKSTVLNYAGAWKLVNHGIRPGAKVIIDIFIQVGSIGADGRGRRIIQDFESLIELGGSSEWRLSDNAKWAVEQGYDDGPLLLEMLNEK